MSKEFNSKVLPDDWLLLCFKLLFLDASQSRDWDVLTCMLITIATKSEYKIKFNLVTPVALSVQLVQSGFKLHCLDLQID